MSTGTWIAFATVGIGFAALCALLALNRLQDKPYEYEPELLSVDEFFGELLEDADVQEMLAKRKGREGR